MASSNTSPLISRRSFLGRAGMAGVAVASVAGCGGLSRGGDNGAQQAASSPGTVSISVLDRPRTTDKGRLAAYDETVRAFLSKHPAVKMDVREVLDGGAMAKTLPAKLANGSMETLFLQAPEDGYLYASKQQLALIDDLVTGWENSDQLRPDVLEHCRDDAGKLFGLPCRGNMRGMYYSRARFQQAGLDPDSPPTTWDEYREAAGRLTNRAKNQYGVGNVGGGDGTITFLNWLYSAGGQTQVEEGGKLKATLDSPQAVSVLQLLKEMRWQDQSISPVLYQSISKDLMGDLATGRVAMTDHAPTGTADVRKFGGKLDAFSFGPTPQNGGNAVFESLTAYSFAPNASKEQLAAAFQFATYSKFDPEAAEIRLKGMQQDGAFIPLQADSVAVLKPDSPVRKALDAVQAKYAGTSAENSAAYYQATNGFKGFGFPLIDPATVNDHIASVVEAVLTKRDADIESLLGDLNTKTQKIIDER
jgi:multiple sugar transport system substrate-binding protein